MNRTASSPVVMSPHYQSLQQQTTSPTIAMTNNHQQQRSVNTSPSSLSISPSIVSPTAAAAYYYSPPKNSSNQHHHHPHSMMAAYSPSSASTTSSIRFSSKSTSLHFNSKQQQQQQTGSQPVRKAGGRMLSGVNWMHRGGRGRILSACMEISLHKVKTKIDFYTDLSTAAMLEEEISNKDETTANKCPYLYRIALAIGDIEIRDKLATSAFNMFLFRYESEQCPKHANSNMIFFKLLCSKSMDSQRLLECDIKLSVQPLRYVRFHILSSNTYFYVV